METKIQSDKEKATLTLNPKMYPLPTIYSAAYAFLDRSYILLDGDPEKEIIVTLTPKTKESSPEKLAKEFANELINYADYTERAKETRKLREILLQRALFTNDPGAFTPPTDDFDEEEFNKLIEELDKEEIEDPEQIAVPWEEKYGKDATQQ